MYPVAHPHRCHAHEAPHLWCGMPLQEVEETWMQDPMDQGASTTAVGGDGFHANRAGVEEFVVAVAMLVPGDRVLPVWLQVHDSSFTP
jgi:hypothetical protein